MNVFAFRAVRTTSVLWRGSRFVIADARKSRWPQRCAVRIVVFECGMSTRPDAMFNTLRTTCRRWLRYLAIGIVSLPFLYLLSFGPACWFVDRRLMTNSPDAGPVAFKLAGIYCPLVRLSAKCAPLKWYAT